jgi:hypothetical protein
MFLLLSMAIVGWVLTAALGTQACFRDEQMTHTRDLRKSFARLIAMMTGQGTDLSRGTIHDRTDRTRS